MEPNKPLNTEQKIELEMDKVIELEQEPMELKRFPFWLIGGIIFALIYLLKIIYNFYFLDSRSYICSLDQCSPVSILANLADQKFWISLSGYIILGIIIGFLYGKLRNKRSKQI